MPYVLACDRPMASAPRDGSEILARAAGRETYFRVAWDGSRWASDGHAVANEFAGWARMPGRAA